MSGLRLAIGCEFFNDIDKEIKQLVDAAALELGKLTGGVQEISLSTEIDRTVVSCEPYVYHQRHLPAHEQENHPETLKRIPSGADVTATQYLESYPHMQRHPP